MCGIVGYVGDQEAVPILIGGLAKLEYRGYDSAGVAVLQGEKIEVRRSVGKLANLQKSLKEKEPRSKMPTRTARKVACSCTTASSKTINP